MFDIKKRQRELIELFNSAPIKKTFGTTLRYDDQDSAIFEHPYNPNLDHALNGVHGGVIATLIDNAGWFTIAAHYETWIVTVELSVRLLEPVSGQKLVSRGWIVRKGKTVSQAGMEVKTDDGKLIATGAGTFMVISTAFSAKAG